MTGRRFTPKPSATNFSSAAWSWTNTTSASPRRAMSSAWPVPSATTRTLMPVSFSNIGSRWREQARLLGRRRRRHDDELFLGDPSPGFPAPEASRRLRPAVDVASQSFSFEKCRRLGSARRVGKTRGPATARPAGPPAGTPRRSRGASPARGCAWSSRSSCRARGCRGRCPRPRGSPSGRGSPSARRGTALRGAAPTRGRAPAAAARRRKARARIGWRARAARLRPAHRRCARRLRRRAIAGEVERIADVRGGRAAQQHRALEHHRLAGGPSRAAAPRDRAARTAPTRPCSTRSSVLLPEPFGPEDQRAGAAVDRRGRRRARMRVPLRPTAMPAHTIGSPRRGLRVSHSARAPTRARTARRALTISTIAISTTPSASASGRSPLLVSSAIVVVITRVTPSMLPPTIITAPTSAIARPKPASSTVASEKRVSQISVSAADGRRRAQRRQLLAVLAPCVGDHLPRQRGDDRRDEDRLRDRSSRPA